MYICLYIDLYRYMYIIIYSSQTKRSFTEKGSYSTLTAALKILVPLHPLGLLPLVPPGICPMVPADSKFVHDSHRFRNVRIHVSNTYTYIYIYIEIFISI